MRFHTTHHFRVGNLSGMPGKVPREGCVNAKGLLEPHEWRVSAI